ncbi:actin maturation protease [Cydia amplana]|uniref:actin maturation protease n=1 Tax=Cydia amplana TaxID=1869771 RepID=UPI002FE52B0A
MCSLPPPPPPPPQTLDLKHDSPELPSYADSNPTPKFPEICEWASKNLDLWEACAKNSICHQIAPFKYCYKHFESILQVGPTCGLAALSMLVRGKVSASEMLDVCKQEGYSNNGEMLSSKDMVKLAEKVFSLADIEGVSCGVKFGHLFSHDIIEKLLDGAVLLVPYDADANHSPCLRQGHKAHWALISGVIICKNPRSTLDSDPDNVYVLCRHGKSRFLATWRLFDLYNSNKNLWEFIPPKGKENQLFIIPKGGIGGVDGLRKQFVIFHGL